jgi:3-oxoacyl-[acyl-carrier protein] reductase
MSKTIFITGSSRGIGSEIARLAAKSGYRVILHGKSISSSLTNLASELECEYLNFDICNEQDIVKGLSDLNEIDILVNSAGINISNTFTELSGDDWKKVYSTNVFGLANVIKHSIPLLKKTPGTKKIVNIASIKGLYSSVGRVAYASSKAAVINLTTGLAKELAPDIIVNAVAPGFTKTDMTQDTWSDRIKSQVDSILLKRMAHPIEVAKLVIFLSSEDNEYITGQTINIDGGFSIKNE